MTTHYININLDKKCKKCGKKGVAQNGLCLDCSSDLIEKQIDNILKKKPKEAKDK